MGVLARAASLFQLDLFAAAAAPAKIRAATPADSHGTTATDAADMLARLRALGLREITSIRLTRNHTVMVSFRGDRLRLHRGYLDAPPDVLQAIVTFVRSRRRAVRRRAARVLLDFERARGLGVPARRRPAVMHPADARLAQKLAVAHAQLNAIHFGGALRPIRVAVSRKLRRRLGHYTSATGDHPAEIVVGRRHIRRDGWNAACETLLHEMVHQWQDETGQPIDHGRAFRRKAREVGIHPRAIAPMRKLPDTAA